MTMPQGETHCFKKNNAPSLYKFSCVLSVLLFPTSPVRSCLLEHFSLFCLSNGKYGLVIYFLYGYIAGMYFIYFFSCPLISTYGLCKDDRLEATTWARILESQQLLPVVRVIVYASSHVKWNSGGGKRLYIWRIECWGLTAWLISWCF